MIVLAFFAFISGIITILSPCILPVLPIVLSGSIGGKSKPLGIVTGFIASFTVFTLTLSSIVQLLGIPPQNLRFIAIGIITIFGLVLLIPKLQFWFEIAVSRFVKVKQNSKRKGFTGGFLVGTSLGLIWTPCVGPIMASVITLAISQEIDGGAVLIMLSYSFGTAIPMFAIMIGSRKLLNRFPKLVANTGKIQRIFGVIMIALGISIGFGLDRDFQTYILDKFPDYGSKITAIEDNQVINEALEKREEERE